MPAAKKKATTSYKGIKTTYDNGMKTTTWKGSFGPKENIAGMKSRAEKLSLGKKDVAAAKRGDKSYSAKSVAMKKDTAAAKRNQGKKNK